MYKNLKGFTLVEILVVLAITSLLVGIVLAAMGPSREAARQKVCASNLHQIGLAVSMYRSDYDGIEPAAGMATPYWQLGLPSLTMFASFSTAYIKDRNVLLCPDYHGRIPIKNLVSTYAWVPDQDLGYPTYNQYSRVVARRGDSTPLSYDDQHNFFSDVAKLPRWTVQRVIILRLSGLVQSRDVPIKGLQPDDW